MNQTTNIVIPRRRQLRATAPKQLVDERPPLSKSFLAGKDSEDAININREYFYQAHGIELRLHCEITAVDVNGTPMKITIRRLTPSLWPALRSVQSRTIIAAFNFSLPP